MGKLIFTLTFFMSFPLFALVPSNFFQNDLNFFKKAIDQVQAKNIQYDERNRSLFQKVIKDEKNRVNKEFLVTPYFEEPTEFWFNIYSLYDADIIAIHDKDHLGLVYDLLDYSELKSSILNRFTKYSLQGQLTKRRVREIRTSLTEIGKNQVKSELSKKILKSFNNHKIKIPKQKIKKRKFFNYHVKNLRAQTGQKNSIQLGLDNYQIHRKSIEELFDRFKLPKELLVIPFLESSFNPKATSKVGAKGIWQFMRKVASSFLPMSRSQDGRLSIILATFGAAHLLKQNYKLLKRWDLAVTAYNSGTKHIFKAKRKLKKKKFDLEMLFENYSHPHIGFASRNFYSSFLALVYAMAYKDELFNIKKSVGKRVPRIFVSLCKIQPKWFYRALKKGTPDIAFLNRHLLKSKKKYPRGTVLMARSRLTKRRYFEVKGDNLINIYPRDWYKLIKGHKCSIK